MATPNTLYKSVFCDDCGNLMMVSTQPDGSSIFRCRAVPQHTQEIEADRVVMVVRRYREHADAGDTSSIPNSVMLSDPTLPRVRMRCEKCKPSAQSVVYAKIDAKRMVYQYMHELPAHVDDAPLRHS